MSDLEKKFLSGKDVCERWDIEDYELFKKMMHTIEYVKREIKFESPQNPGAGIIRNIKKRSSRHTTSQPEPPPSETVIQSIRLKPHDKSGREIFPSLIPSVVHYDNEVIRNRKKRGLCYHIQEIFFEEENIKSYLGESSKNNSFEQGACEYVKQEKLIDATIKTLLYLISDPSPKTPKPKKEDVYDQISALITTREWAEVWKRIPSKFKRKKGDRDRDR